MRCLFWVYCILFTLPIPLYAQPDLPPVFEESFEGMSLSGWSGDVNDFIFSQSGRNTLLQLNADSAGSSMLSIPIGPTIGYWEIYIEHNFSPSNNNKTEFYLSANHSDLRQATEGYKLRVGENGSDDVIRLFRLFDGHKTEEIITGSLNISSGGGYRIRVYRDHEGNWTIFSGSGYEAVLQADGSAIDLSYNADSSYFGFISSYTKSNLQNIRYDFKTTFSPLRVRELSVIDSLQLSIIFNKEPDPFSISTEKFILNDSFQPKNWSLASSDSLVLTFQESMPKGSNALSIRNLSDAGKNTVLEDTLIFFNRTSNPKKGDILINEIMKDPPGNVPEYVEIFNSSKNDYFNLKGWFLSDASSDRQLSSETLIIAPQSYLVLTSDTLSLIDHFGSISTHEFSLPSLNNGEDEVILSDQSGMILDSVKYFPHWNGKDRALERRSHAAPTYFSENWMESLSKSGGTPGKPNKILADSTGPKLQSISNSGNAILILNFDERIAESSVNISAFFVDGSPAVQSFGLINNELTLFLANKLLSGNSYQIKILNSAVADIFKNGNTPIDTSYQYFDLSFANPGDVVLNEIFHIPEDASKAEFVELYNPTEYNFSLSGWKILNKRKEAFVFPTGFILPSKSYAIVQGEGFLASEYKSNLLTGLPEIHDRSDLIKLVNEHSQIMDSLLYTPDWGLSAEGISIEKLDPSGASIDPSNWALNIKGAHSAGSINSAYKEDLIGPEIIYAHKISMEICIHLDEFSVIDPTISITLNEVKTSDPLSGELHFGNRITFIMPESTTETKGPIVRIDTLRDFKGNIRINQSFRVSEEIDEAPGNITINEFLYDPIADSHDHLPDQREYVELYNRASYPIDLTGLFFHRGSDESGNIQALFSSDSKPKWIQPEGYFLVLAENEADSAQNSTHFEYFQQSFPGTGQVMLVDRSSLGLRNSGDTIVINGPESLSIDSLHYEESWHNPNLLDHRGYSLEKINPDLNHNSQNWTTSTHASGGTPLQLNSVLQHPEDPSNSKDILKISPNPFSPDGDGKDDSVFIQYRLEEPDYLLHVRIFDRYGRYITTLADDSAAGFEGTLIWDGFTEERTKNRMGLYILIFEAYHPEKGSEIKKKALIALAR